MHMKELFEVNKDKVKKLCRLVIKTQIGDEVFSGWYYFNSQEKLIAMKDKIIAQYNNIVEVDIQIGQI